MAQRLERQDVRLDKFLRGRLRQEVYEQVTSSEACVIISPDEKRVHRYAVLGHRCLFSTEFPPKNLKMLLQLEDIVSVDMVSLQVFILGRYHHGGYTYTALHWYHRIHCYLHFTYQLVWGIQCLGNSHS